jgi:lysozyme family protein
MAEVRKLAPIILKWEAGVPPEKYVCANVSKPITLEEQWVEAVKKGFSNHPNDTGGATMCGITLKTYTSYCKKKGRKEPTVDDLKKISLCEWLDVLKSLYWDKMKADKINNQSIANLCVDNVWGSGSGYIKNIQRVLGVTADGIVGDQTLSAINNHPNQRELFGKLWERRRMFYVNLTVSRPSDQVFLKGWMNRLYDFKYSE